MMNERLLLGIMALGGLLLVASRAKPMEKEIAPEEKPPAKIPEEKPITEIPQAVLTPEEEFLKGQIEKALSPYQEDFEYANRITELNNEELLKGLVFRESSGNAEAMRYEPKIDDYSIGLGQVLFSTAQDMGFQGTRDELFEPHINLILTAKYLKYHLDLNDGKIPVAVSAYNAGFKGSRYYNQTGEFLNPGYVSDVLKYTRLLKI